MNGNRGRLQSVLSTLCHVRTQRDISRKQTGGGVSPDTKSASSLDLALPASRTGEK